MKSINEEKSMFSKRVVFMFLGIALASALAACGGAATPTIAPPTEAPAKPTEAEPIVEEGMLPGVNPLELSGDIVTAGSSTVFPLAERMAERFQDEGFGGNVTIDSIGSGAGFERFCVAGETDVSNASRPIKDSEKESCADIGRTPIQFRVGTDAVAVTVSQENDFAEDVSGRTRRSSASSPEQTVVRSTSL